MGEENRKKAYGLFFFFMIITIIMLSGCGNQGDFLDFSETVGLAAENSAVTDEKENASESIISHKTSQINTKMIEKIFKCNDGIDMMRAVHRTVSYDDTIYLSYNENDLFYMSIGGELHHPLGIENDSKLHVCSVTTDIYGRLSLLMANEQYDKWFIWQLDENRQVCSKIDISECFETKYVPNWFLIDKDGRYYLQWPIARNGVVLDSNGMLMYKTSTESLGIQWIYEAAVGKNGSIYLIYRGDETEKQFGIFDLESGILRKEVTHETFPADEVVSFAHGGTDTALVFYSPYSGIWVFDDEKGILENRVLLSEIQDESNKEFIPLTFLEDGRIVLVANNEDSLGVTMKYIPVGK